MSAISSSKVVTVDQANEWGYQLTAGLKFTGTDLSESVLKEATRLQSVAAGIVRQAQIDGMEFVTQPDKFMAVLKAAGEKEKLANEVFKKYLESSGLTCEYADMDEFLRNR